MPKAPPNKKLKQMDLQSSFQQRPKKQTARDDKSGETSQDAQERMGYSCQKQEEKPSKSQLNAEGKTYTFEYRIRNGEINTTVCDASKTVFGAIHLEHSDVEGKEIIIRRPNGKNHGAAVKTDFPCCLIEEDETLQINTYKNKKTESTNQERTTYTDPKSLVTFYIRTRGMKKKQIMKSSVFSENNIDYVCVFAHRRDTFKKALQRDGRFLDAIFDNDWKLVEDEKKTHQMDLLVDHSNGKKFDLNVTWKKPKASVRSDKNVGESVHHNQQPENTKQKPIQEEKTPVTDPPAEGQETQNTSVNSSGDSGNSFHTGIKEILQTLCKDVVNQLKKQEVQKYLQKEYDKGLECFTAVTKVRQILELSNSVCVIVIDESDRGTGFLLFDRFILTNAHVVEDFVVSSKEAPHTHKLSKTLRAVFDFEVVGCQTQNLQAKSDLIAYRYEKNDKHTCHDFALLELEAAPRNCTELLSCYKHAPSSKSGGIYIVGHPGCGVKKIDPCIIIETKDQQQSINKYISENPICPYIAWQCLPFLHKNRITYNSCFIRGSSGSPVFDEHCYLIGMHTGGFCYKEGEKTRSVIEFSFSMQPILESIISQVKMTRHDILKLLSKFESIRANYNLGEMEDANGANVPIKEEQESEDEKMEEGTPEPCVLIEDPPLLQEKDLTDI